MSTVILVLPYPVSANRYWQTRVMKAKSAAGRPMATTFLSADAKKYKKEVARLAKEAGVVAPIAGRVQIDIRLFPNRPQDWKTRMRKLGAAWDDSVSSIDLDNATKVTLDALKGIALEDDKWVRCLTSKRMEPDAHGPRLVVRVQSLQVEQTQLALAQEGT